MAMSGPRSWRRSGKRFLAALLAGTVGCHTLKTQLAGGPNGSTTTDTTAVKHVQVFTSGKPIHGFLGLDDHSSPSPESELVPDYAPRSRIAVPSFHFNDRYPSGSRVWSSPFESQPRHHPHN
jgi:hypothetical protein